MENSGFIYIWRDKKHNRYYIGSHWGTENDGYVCSSTWMKNSWKRRPADFSRRFLAKNIGRVDLLFEEHKWLAKIKDEELGVRYYNLTKHLNGHWATDAERAKIVAEKISKAEGRKEKISAAHKGKILTEQTKNKIRSIRLGSKHTGETKRKISENHNRVYGDDFKKKMSQVASNRTIDTRAKISENNRRLINEGKIGMKGRKHSEETKRKMSLAAQLRRS